MDTLLNQHVIFLEDFEEVGLEPNRGPMSLWVKDNDIFKPSTNISIQQKLDPGFYMVESDREIGLYCRKIIASSDELFTFSNPLISDLLSEIELFWQKQDVYKANNLIHKRGILLEGYPGTGKSSIITQIAESVIEAGGVVFKVRDFKNLNDYVDFIHESFRKIQPTTPIITIIEDIDKYGHVETELLEFLDGKTNINHHIVIATSNDTEEIPDTLLRPSRFDIKIEIPMPDEKTRREYFVFKEVSVESLDTLVSESEDFSLADLKEVYICIYLLDYTIEEAIEKIKFPKNKKNYLNKSNKSSKIGF